MQYVLQVSVKVRTTCAQPLIVTYLEVSGPYGFEYFWKRVVPTVPVFSFPPLPHPIPATPVANFHLA